MTDKERLEIVSEMIKELQDKINNVTLIIKGIEND